MPADTLSRQLVRHVLGLRYENLPPEVIAKAKQCILDQLGAELIASTCPWLQPVHRFVQEQGGKPESTVVNFGTRTTAPYAAYANASFGQGCEWDDVVVGGAHVGAAVVPTAMALGEREHIGGKEFLTTVVAGYEAMTRVGRAIFNTTLRRGFHPQSINGVFGAAAVAGRLLGLDEETMVNAFGIAGSHCCGITEYAQVGSEVKRIHAGIAVQGGIQATLLARHGLTGPPTVLEGKRGVYQAFADEYDLEAVTRGLGQEFTILQTWFKNYPAVGTHHSPLDALSQLIQQHRFHHREVQEVNVGLGGVGVTHGGTIRRPHDATGAQFSLGYSLALRLVKGRNDLALYMDPKLWEDEETLAVAEKVKPYRHPEAGGEDLHLARVEVVLKDGRRFEATQRFPKGSPENPLTPQELQNKFRSLASQALSPAAVEGVAQAVEGLEGMKDVSSLVSLLVRK